MLRPWNSAVTLWIAPGRVSGSVARGWPRRRTLARNTQAISDWLVLAETADPAQAALAGSGLASTIDAVMAELELAAPLAQARLNVILADALVYLDVANGDFLDESDRQLQVLASACMNDLLGDKASEHDVRWHLQTNGRHLLIAAVARGLLDELVAAADRHKMSLGSVQPELCHHWNRHGAALKPGHAVFAVASGQDAVVASVTDGAIVAVSSGSWLDPATQTEPMPALNTETPSGAQADRTPTTRALDARTHRLLASIGLEAASQSTFILVAPNLPAGTVSPCWTVLPHDAPTP